MGFVGTLTVNLLLLEYVLYVQWRTHGPVWWLVLLMLYGAVLLVPVGHLFGFHLYLTAKNLTTNEIINSHRYQYLRGADGTYRNPFDRGVLTNFADRCLPAHYDGHSKSKDDHERVAFLQDVDSHAQDSNDVASLPV
jgi:hypothetical protein